MTMWTEMYICVSSNRVVCEEEEPEECGTQVRGSCVEGQKSMMEGTTGEYCVFVCVEYGLCLCGWSLGCVFWCVCVSVWSNISVNVEQEAVLLRDKEYICTNVCVCKERQRCVMCVCVCECV